MTRSAIIGGRGFIGSAVVRTLTAAGHDVVPVGRETSLKDVGPVDAAFFCAGNSAAHLSKREPLSCLKANIADLYSCLVEMRARRWVIMSSVSVYPVDLPLKREDAPIDLLRLPIYGAHKALAERYVLEYAPEAVLLRIGYLFGAGLKKNLFYDLKNGARELFLTPESVLAPLNVQEVASIALRLSEDAEPGIYNVASRHRVTAQDVASMVPGEHIFRNERHVDESALSLDRLHRYWRQEETSSEYRARLAAFLNESSEAPSNPASRLLH